MASANYPNFYESLPEARRRLLNNVVLYDGEPCFMLAITDHKEDGIFRAYLEPLKDPDESSLSNHSKWNESCCPVFDYSYDYPALGESLDKWMKANPDAPLLRKTLNSPKFKKFRPFPLGMVNLGGDVYYMSKRPLRRSDQGLIEDQLSVHKHELVRNKSSKLLQDRDWEMGGTS